VSLRGRADLTFGRLALAGGRQLEHRGDAVRFGEEAVDFDDVHVELGGGAHVALGVGRHGADGRVGRARENCLRRHKALAVLRRRRPHERAQERLHGG